MNIYGMSTDTVMVEPDGTRWVYTHIYDSQYIGGGWWRVLFMNELKYCLVNITDFEDWTQEMHWFGILNPEPEECPICYQEKRNGVLLWCRHSLCQECFYELMKKVSEDRLKEQCPCCRRALSSL